MHDLTRCESSSRLGTSTGCQQSIENAIEKSQPAKEGRSRLSARIRQAQFEHTHGAQLGIRIANGILDFSSLSPRDQQLVADDAKGCTARKLRNVLDEHLEMQPPYRGAGVLVALV